ncbi:hypothetical protein BURMUCF2_2371 [Burkholderia multivorans CF2]|nr:hypothetical protein BURMUCF2_2371 [Burkholderia multivorans CF2]
MIDNRPFATGCRAPVRRSRAAGLHRRRRRARPVGHDSSAFPDRRRCLPAP